MKLNNKAKDELRLEIEKRLEQVPEGTRIHLDKDLLEDLLFDVLYNEDEPEDHYIKLPVWSGEFLSKIDLSEVSFNHLLAGFPGVDMLDCEMECMVDRNIYSAEIAKYYDYSLIGDKKTLKPKYSKQVIYKNINAKFDSETYHTIFTNIDFEGTDLSNYNATTSDFYSKNCNFKNTGLQINFDYMNNDIFVDLILAGKLDGCYLNGMLINQSNRTELVLELFMDKKIDFKMLKGKIDLSEKSSRENKQRLKEEYLKLKEDIFSSVLGSIDEQVKTLK